MIDFENLKLDYLPNEEDDDAMRRLKENLFKLTEPEQRVFLLYTEIGSYAGVAKLMNCSAPTVKKYVEIIRDKIK